MSKKVSKALPILAIVFYGVSLILLSVKSALMVGQGLLNEQAVTQVLLSQLVRTVAFALPAVFFILYAAKVLKRSRKAKIILTIALALQAACAAYFGVRIAINNKDWGQLLGKENAFILCFAVMFVCCVIGMIFTLQGKKATVPLIIAAVAGFGVAAVLFLWNGIFMIGHSAYYTANSFQLVIRFSAYTVYTLALIFDFIALIFVACTKERERKVAVKMKAKSVEA